MLSRVFIRIGLISATAMLGSSRTSMMIDDLMLIIVYLSSCGGLSVIVALRLADTLFDDNALVHRGGSLSITKLLI